MATMDSHTTETKEGEAISVTTKSEVDVSAGDVKQAISNADTTYEQKNFAERLFELLDTPELQEIIHWVPSGEAFCVTDQKAFESKIMPKHFPTAKFESFARRMRRWGFHRVESTDQRNRGIIMFMCPRFRRGRPDLCKAMCDDRQLKKKSAGPGEAGAGRLPSNGAPPRSSNGDHQLKTNGCHQNQAGAFHTLLVQSVMIPNPYLNPASMGFVVPPPVNSSPALALQQASLKNSVTQSLLSNAAAAYKRQLTGSTLPISMASNTALAPIAFNLPIQPNLLQLPVPTSNSRRDLVNIQANLYQVEAELAVVSRMKELKQRSLSLAAMRAVGGHGPSMKPGQGSQTTAPF